MKRWGRPISLKLLGVMSLSALALHLWPIRQIDAPQLAIAPRQLAQVGHFPQVQRYVATLLDHPPRGESVDVGRISCDPTIRQY